MEQFTMTDARNRFAEIVRMAERGVTVQLFRRGKPVAVVLSIREYQQLDRPGDFWAPLTKFREQIELGERQGVEPDTFAGVRDRSL